MKQGAYWKYLAGRYEPITKKRGIFPVVHINKIVLFCDCKQSFPF